VCALRLLAMPDHPPKPPKPSLPPPRLPLPKQTSPEPRTPTTRASGSSEIPPPIVLSDSPTPPLGVPKVAAFEPRAIEPWRDHVPSLDQWIIAGACVLAAAAVGFAVGRSSVRASPPAMSAATQHAACPEATNHPSVVSPASEGHVETPSTSAESPAPSPVTSAAPDPADQLATAKAIARAMTRGSRRAASCRGAASSSGTAHIAVTFLPSGDVKTATVRGAPFAGTAEGECIVGKFRSLRVPPFTGDNVTVHKDLALE
jgi:hypothetical protein